MSLWISFSTRTRDLEQYFHYFSSLWKYNSFAPAFSALRTTGGVLAVILTHPQKQPSANYESLCCAKSSVISHVWLFRRLHDLFFHRHCTAQSTQHSYSRSFKAKNGIVLTHFIFIFKKYKQNCSLENVQRFTKFYRIDL